MKGTLMKREVLGYTSPVSLIREIDRALDDIFRRFFGAYEPAAVTESGEMVWTPAVDVVETPDSFEVYMVLPHADANSLKVRAQDNALVISGETRMPYELKDDSTLLYNEVLWGRFHRSIQLPAPVNWDKVKAEYRNGLLHVHLPKAEEVKTREIRIEVK